jgi:isopentenyl-diphosphate delta-isomerase
VHRDGRLHRAISVFVVDDERGVLLQRRSLSKLVAPGLWSNTCCTHPRPGESPAAAARRRLLEEMGLRCRLKKVLSFTYSAKFPGGWVEHELDHVFVGRTVHDPKPDASEVAEWRWVQPDALQTDVRRRPSRYTPWLRAVFPKLKDVLSP